MLPRWLWGLGSGVFGADIIVEESILVCFLLPTSIITAAICANSAEESLDTTAFVVNWMVAVKT